MRVQMDAAMEIWVMVFEGCNVFSEEAHVTFAEPIFAGWLGLLGWVNHQKSVLH